MLISSLCILLATLAYFFLNMKNKRDKHLYIVIFYFISCALLLTASVFYTATASKYTSAVPFEMEVLFMLLPRTLHVTQLSDIYNVTVAAFMLSSIACILIADRSRLKLCIALLPLILIFLYINSSSTTWDMFIVLNSGNAPPVTRLIFKNLWAVNTAVISVFQLVPVLIIYNQQKNTKLSFMKKYYTALNGAIIIIDLYYSLVLNVFFRSIRYKNLSLAKLPIASADISVNTLSVFITFVAIFMVIFLMLYYRPFNSVVISRRKDLESNMKSTGDNLNMVLHTYKNAFISIDRIAGIINENSTDTETLASCASTLENISKEQLDIINRTLSLTRISELIFSEINLADTVHEAMKEVYIPDNIKISLNFENPKKTVYGDSFYLKEAFKNMIENAITALKQTQKPDPLINITIYSDNEYIVIEFYDNGTGIEKSKINKIFNLYYSSKPSKECGGVGLYFVRNVINLHHGEIEVMSEPGEYTSFLIILHDNQ